MSVFGGKTYLIDEFKPSDQRLRNALSPDPEGNNRLPKNGGWAQDVRHGYLLLVKLKTRYG
jgi:hypothetical protein